jgi:hypothetical protein
MNKLKNFFYPPFFIYITLFLSLTPKIQSEIISNPCRTDGFGAQYQTIIYSVIYAELNNKEFRYSPFKKMEHNCPCGKKYKHHSSLYAHKKKCKSGQEIVSLPVDNSEIIINLLKQNNELHKKILEMNTNTNTNLNQIENQTNITNNNTTFNLNFFLNETCKDAMNIEDFIASIHLQLKDLLHVGQVGYVRGISDIIIHNLKKLDITKRPLHCSDYKREIMYIKDKDIWEKDTEQKKAKRLN